jgi:hypothetical protein
MKSKQILYHENKVQESFEKAKLAREVMKGLEQKLQDLKQDNSTLTAGDLTYLLSANIEQNRSIYEMLDNIDDKLNNIQSTYNKFGKKFDTTCSYIYKLCFSKL